MHQANLFGSSMSPENLALEDAEISYDSGFINTATADDWFKQLLDDTPWDQDTITVYGKKHLTPRLSYWVGERWMDYSYAQHTMTPKPWTPLLETIKEQVERASQTQFNSVLINYYRDGQDSNAWHSDDEPELGDKPVIGSLSLGAARDFHLRHKAKKQTHKMTLEPGSLLVMSGKTQACWQHQVPKRALALPRINLTFRTIVRLK